MSSYKDRETVERLYWEEELNLAEVADRLDCTKMTIHRWMKKMEIPRRDQAGVVEEQPWHNEDTLWNLYRSEGKSIRDIADEFDVHHQTIEYWIEKHEIETRDRLEFVKTGPCAHYWSHGYETVASTFDGERSESKVHRLVMVAEHGFNAVCGKEVHHTNEVKWDNRPENLQILTPEEHSRLHAKEREFWKESPNGQKHLS